MFLAFVLLAACDGDDERVPLGFDTHNRVACDMDWTVYTLNLDGGCEAPCESFLALTKSLGDCTVNDFVCPQPSTTEWRGRGGCCIQRDSGVVFEFCVAPTGI